jgi:hypothetical protein
VCGVRSQRTPYLFRAAPAKNAAVTPPRVGLGTRRICAIDGIRTCTYTRIIGRGHARPPPSPRSDDSLERLVRDNVARTTVTTISTATERLAEEMACEFLKDPAVRAELHALIQKHFGGATNGTRRRGRKAARRRR